MNNFKLYINGQLADLNGDESVLFTKQRTDYTNPTIIKNSFTKSIRIPGSSRNHQIFNEIWKLDRVQWDGSFNASKRVPFVLLKNGTLSESGYIKLEKIVWDSKTRVYDYDVTLFGEVGSIFYKLSYKYNDATDDVTPLSLADLDFGFSKFLISRNFIEEAWRKLKTGEGEYIFNTINFCVSYDGVPNANNFDAKKVWCSTNRNVYEVVWQGQVYGYSYANSFPVEYINEGTRYRSVSTRVSRNDPNDQYGLLQFKNDLTALETRDLRSYLLRPVISISSIFNAINGYLSANEGYTLDMSDPFFSSDEFTGTWMTLPMLYEADPDVQSFSIVFLNKLLQGTSSPADYLISYCKIYGIYIDVDIVDRKILLRRLPNFFKDENSNLRVDKGRDIIISPLSFDKATYTFNYAEGDGEFLKKYNDMYGVQYGSKRVNTGYSFSADEAPYIDNNVFKQAVDALEQSKFYNYPVEGSGLYQQVYKYPIGIYDYGNLPEYKLFNDINMFGGEMSDAEPGTTRLDQGTYELIDERWAGLKTGRYQDGFPKVQLHGEGNSMIDGKGVLVRFNGFQTVNRGYEDGYNFYKYSNEPVVYLLSDDWASLRKYIGGKNCYYDNPDPNYGYGVSYITVINEIPSFSVCSYNYTPTDTKYPSMLTYFNDVNILTLSGVTVAKGGNVFNTTIVSSSGRKYPYIVLPQGKIQNGHRYLLMSVVSTDNAPIINTNNPYNIPDIANNVVIDKRELENSDKRQMILSLVDVPEVHGTVAFSPLSTYNAGSTVSFDVYQMGIYDLTELGMGNMTDVDEVADLLGLSAENNNGYLYDITNTFNFGNTRELFVPGTISSSGTTIYDRYWSRYISDVYSINTRILECYCFLDNTEDTFRRFYSYDNALWILSKIVDWAGPEKVCKATFIKVNDKQNYLQ